MTWIWFSLAYNQTYTPKKVQVSGAVRGIYLVPHLILHLKQLHLKRNPIWRLKNEEWSTNLNNIFRFLKALFIYYLFVSLMSSVFLLFFCFCLFFSFFVFVCFLFWFFSCSQSPFSPPFIFIFCFLPSYPNLVNLFLICIRNHFFPFYSNQIIPFL